MNFPGGSICSSNRHEFSRRVLCSSNRHEFSRRAYRKEMFFSRRFYLFIEQTLLSHQTDTNFPRNPYLVLEHIRIFQEPLFFHRTDIRFPGSPRTHTIFQKTLSNLQTHTIFQETPMPRTDTHFPGRYAPSNRYFINRSRWLLSNRKVIPNRSGCDLQRC